MCCIPPCSISVIRLSNFHQHASHLFVWQRQQHCAHHFRQHVNHKCSHITRLQPENIMIQCTISGLVLVMREDNMRRIERDNVCEYVKSRRERHYLLLMRKKEARAAEEDCKNLKARSLHVELRCEMWQEDVIVTCCHCLHR